MRHHRNDLGFLISWFGTRRSVVQIHSPRPFLVEGWCGFGTYQICQSFIWNNGIRTSIPTLGGNNGDVADIDGSGQLILGFAETTFHDPTCTPPQVLGFEAFLWKRRTNDIQVLPPLPGDSITAAFDMNDNGEVAGTSGTCTTGIAPSSATHARSFHPVPPCVHA
jgi:uncharacterized membrane protein